MQTIKMQLGQVMIDAALQMTGDAAKIFDVALLNGIGITDDLATDEVLLVPDADLDKEDIINYFSRPANFPASGDMGVEQILVGIGYMQIGVDFKVSWQEV